ncbi:M14 metallopeptidase family protein [Spongiivirga sp. MCCC 1A20706]|uniref:M14 family metallopeptidase n=1 Tax=Spongiivirga sp. MCCC 1A20706 TaxID=3160963 RepID=UPI00397771B7
MIQNFISSYPRIKEESLMGRYISTKHIAPLITKYNAIVVGESVLQNPIHKIQIGNGVTKILMWSQMHGNESTTTKALFDFLNFLSSDDPLGKEILRRCTLVIIPMLNPDGANVYTRVNANEIDLNRDAQDLSQPESKVLRNVFEEFEPHFCFNLHGQRTIFSAGNNSKSASLSFLAPAYNKNRDVNATREAAMRIISCLNTDLQTVLPNQIGRYDDGFNINCVGDSFQQSGASTILFEAGHIDNDYDRETVRTLVAYAIFKCSHLIATNLYQTEKVEEYFSIPNNEKLFYDIILRNVVVIKNGITQSADVAIQYKEVLQKDNIQFIPFVAAINNLNGFFGHQEPMVADMLFKQGELTYPVIDENAENISLNNQLLSKILTKK